MSNPVGLDSSAAISNDPLAAEKRLWCNTFDQAMAKHGSAITAAKHANEACDAYHLRFGSRR